MDKITLTDGQKDTIKLIYGRLTAERCQDKGLVQFFFSGAQAIAIFVGGVMIEAPSDRTLSVMGLGFFLIAILAYSIIKLSMSRRDKKLKQTYMEGISYSGLRPDESEFGGPSDSIKIEKSGFFKMIVCKGSMMLILLAYVLILFSIWLFDIPAQVAPLLASTGT